MAAEVNVRLDTGEPVTLSSVLARAGEGTVYGVAGKPGWVAKVFHPDLADLPTKLGKVAAMVRSTPPGAVQADGLVVLTWPLHLISDERGPIGYVMPKIDTATSVEIHIMSNPSNRMEPLPNAPQWTKNATWGHLVNVAANLCLAVQAVHRVDAVIGDFQERNILVADTTEVTLVDCDSMQFTDASGDQFLCAVGRPEFTAPELAGCDLRTEAREKPSDLFALAIHIHQLLLAGNHPFMRGTWTGEGDQPDALTLAKAGYWAGGPASLFRTHPLAPPIGFLPVDIQQLFTRAFTMGLTDPTLRPSAGEWRQALLRMRPRTCRRNEHQIPESCGQCPWCAIDDEREARRQRQAWAPGASGPQRPASSNRTGPLPAHRGQAAPPKKINPAATGPIRQPAKPAPPPPPWQRPKVVLTALLIFVVTVLIVTAIIVWVILSGPPTPVAAALNVVGMLLT
ncbi:hypothetical protein A7G45_12480 [Mycolicibacterium llatzerense]|nr:hypothetical protein [Mycolicibacterium llatzerense]